MDKLTYIANQKTNYKARYWALTIPLESEEAKKYAENTARQEVHYTTQSSDEGLCIKWGTPEDGDAVYENRHVHVWAYIYKNNELAQKERKTKRVIAQKVIAALRLRGIEIQTLPYIQPLSNRLKYEEYMNKNDTSGNGEITTPGQKLEKLSDPDYLEEIITQVGTDINDIFAYIQKSTGLNYQKILSQKQGIQGYLNARKRIKTGDIKEDMANSWSGNSVKTIITNLKENTELKDDDEERLKTLCTLLYMSTVNRCKDDGLVMPIFYSDTEGTRKTTTLKVIPEELKKTMVTDAKGVGANEFKGGENVLIMEDFSISDITQEKRQLIWSLATGGTTSVKIHSSTKDIKPKWIVGTTNVNIPNELKRIELSGSNKEKTSIKGFGTRFKPIRFNKQWRGNKNQKTLPMTNLQRMQLYEQVIFAISETPITFAEMINENAAWGYYFLEATSVLSEEHPKHNLWQSNGQKRMLQYIEKKVAETRKEGIEDAATPAMTAADALDAIMDTIDSIDSDNIPQAQSLEWTMEDDIDSIMNDAESDLTQKEIRSTLENEQAFEYYASSRFMMRDASFTLRQWASNSKSMQEVIHHDGSNAKSAVMGVLGVKWEPQSDSLSINKRDLTQTPDLTKCIVTSQTVSIFDPLGFVAPMLVPAKIFINTLWEENISLDEKLSPEYLSQWNSIQQSLLKVSEFSFPRWIGGDTTTPLNIIIFCDTCPRSAIGCVSYGKQGDTMTLLGSKNKIISKKNEHYYVPKLELMAMNMGAQYGEKLTNTYGDQYKEINVTYVTDSEIALYWLNKKKTETVCEKPG